MTHRIKAFLVRLLAAAALLGVTTASAETLMMPKRDARTTTPVVVWGVHTQAAGTACSLDFGDGTAPFNCTGVDRSYVATTHTYANQNTYTATLTVGAESATTTIRVFNPALFADGGATGDSNRSLGINMTIEDGLRYLWTIQSNRDPGAGSTTTSWNNSGFAYADTSLVVQAFQNQGYKIQANVAPTGVYEKYIVRRGINFVLANLSTIAMGNTPAGNNPCVVVGDCTGLQPPGDQGYTTALAILSLAGSGAFGQINTEVGNCGSATPGFLCNKTYGNIAQRLVNALAWGQNDSSTGQGGWFYTFNSTVSDGSTLGWDVLALADAEASGLTVPAFVKTEFAKVINTPGGGQLNSDGSFDYNANGALTNNNVGPGKNGIGLQALFLIGELTGARITLVRDNINSWWPGAVPFGIGGDVWGTGHLGNAYAMFNNFKGLKLQGITTLSNVNRSTHAWKFLGTTGVEDDWYADYQDWFVANQTSPATTGGGSWNTMTFSCCASGTALTAAIAELILAPVALVAPDPTLFSTVGLSPASATNPVGTSHTVTAFAQAANGAPVPGVTINFRVMTGPNAGQTGSSSTGADGKTTFTYNDTGGAGTDTIQAFIGTTLSSNVVTKTWKSVCDVNSDGLVTNADLLLIRAKNGQAAAGPGDPYDPNGDGVINVADVRFCQLRLTPP